MALLIIYLTLTSSVHSARAPSGLGLSLPGFWRLQFKGWFYPPIHLGWANSTLLASVPSSPLPILSFSANTSDPSIFVSDPSDSVIELRFITDMILTLRERFGAGKPALELLEGEQLTNNALGWPRGGTLTYTKIENWHSTVDCPLQGLWKGIAQEEEKLSFFLIRYEMTKKIVCYQFTEPDEEVIGNLRPIFWALDTDFMDPPFPSEEMAVYNGSIHSQPEFRGIVVRILCFSSESNPMGTASRLVDLPGRLWQYVDATCVVMKPDPD